MALDYDFEREREFNYSNLSMDEIVRHLSSFVSRLWQIHAFGEGNTRTTAVFTIKYLRSMGFKVGNDIFAKNSWYFRNALVRANYKNVKKGIQQEPEYLEKFFRNLLMGCLRGRTATIFPGVRPSIRRASSPIALILFVSRSNATTEGSFKTTPLPFK